MLIPALCFFEDHRDFFGLLILADFAAPYFKCNMIFLGMIIRKLNNISTVLPDAVTANEQFANYRSVGRSVVIAALNRETQGHRILRKWTGIWTAAFNFLAPLQVPRKPLQVPRKHYPFSFGFIRFIRFGIVRSSDK